jgi:probable addiction module antidote protein
MALKLSLFDAAEYLDDADSQNEFIVAAFETGDPAYIAHALGVIARAQGMTKVARDAGITREALYRSLSADGDPRLSTLLGVAKALGFRIGPVRAAHPDTTA